MSTNSGVPSGKNAIAKIRGMRSVSIQNSSTQVSSKSDTDDVKETKRAKSNRPLQSCPVSKIGKRKSSA